MRKTRISFSFKIGKFPIAINLTRTHIKIIAFLICFAIVYTIASVQEVENWMDKPLASARIGDLITLIILLDLFGIFKKSKD